MQMVDKKQRKLKKKKEINSSAPFKAKSVVPTKSQRGFTTKKPPKVHGLEYPL